MELNSVTNTELTIILFSRGKYFKAAFVLIKTIQREIEREKKKQVYLTIYTVEMSNMEKDK